MPSKKTKIKVRFAPSPTGELHIGGARTALYNYLFAKKNQGEFILRIEDTDKRREVPGSVQRIQDDLNWLGLKWDQGPTLQSENLDFYRKKALELVNSGKAYFCFCSEDRLDTMRKDQVKKKLAPKYDRHCLHLPKSEVDQLIKEKKPYVIRFLVPEKRKIKFRDQIFGEVEFAAEILDDQILFKSDGYPTYHLANVLDDHETGITHVIRGDEWLPSTPKHLLLYEAFGWQPPEFAHLPLIVDSNRRKLSKREHGELVWVSKYRKDGYLPEALLNFLAFLGWNPGKGETQEIYSLNELIKIFSLEQVHKSPAVFDLGKLNDINAKYLRKMGNEKIAEKLIAEKFIENQDKQSMSKLVKIYYNRLQKLNDFKNFSDNLFELPNFEKELLIFSKSDESTTKSGLNLALAELEKVQTANWQVEEINQLLKQIVEKNHLKNGDVFWPVRTALSGMGASPSPSELAWVLGKDETLKRIKLAQEKLI